MEATSSRVAEPPRRSDQDQERDSTSTLHGVGGWTLPWEMLTISLRS
ncbi:hypothetical protein chiPu_0027876, partial [Chiloscyllium punctatum]|nr:hypothetical protein [Chiloscyllium punctatum]